MTLRNLIISVWAAGIAALTPFMASAQEGSDFEDYQVRQSDLVALSALFGEMHHIRRQCNPRGEGDVWRERMKTLVDLEEPQPEARDEMVAAFNKGYRAAQQRFRSCSRNARDHAAARAARGEMIVARLVAPLEKAVEEEPILREIPFQNETLSDNSVNRD